MKSNITGEIAYDIVIIVAVIIYVLINKNVGCLGVPVKMWLIVIASIYGGDSLFLFFQLCHINSAGKESLCIMALRFIGSCVLVGWLIYGNIIYY